MVIMSKRNVIIPAPNGETGKYIPKDYIGEIDKWVTETDYFKSLVADGKIVISASIKDKDIDKAAEKEVKDNTRRRKKAEETEEVKETETEKSKETEEVKE